MRELLNMSDFRAKFSRLAGNEKITREMMQDLIEDALAQASHPNEGGSGSLAKLTIIVQGLAAIKSMPTRVIQQYIKACADVKWCKLKDGTMGWKFIDGTPSVTMPTKTYWDWEGNPNKSAKIDTDVLASLQAIKGQVTKARKKGGNVEHEELLPEIDKLIAKCKGVYADEQKTAAPQPVPFD